MHVYPRIFILPLLFLLLSFVVSPAIGAKIIGGMERGRFDPASRVVLDINLNSCPVGEVPEGVQLLRGALECVRFKDRIWMRPLNAPTVALIPFPKGIRDDFSLEFPVWLAADGCAYVSFHLHTPKHLQKLQQNPDAWINGALLGGRLACNRIESGFGARNSPGRIALAVAVHLKPRKMHHVALQVRRGQVRLYIDGKRIGMLPFTPQQSIGGLSLYFHHAYGHPKPYAKRPALLGHLRLATYTQEEPAPEAEKGLIDDLGAVQTPEGLKVVLPEAILFDFGKWDLKSHSRSVLAKVAQLAALHRKSMLRIEGHTDNVGHPSYNDVLSTLRAHVVALALARLGVDARRLIPRGQGSRHPVASNDTPAGRAKNRRVEITFQPEQ